MPRITIQNDGRTMDAATNANLREALMAEKVDLYPGLSRLMNCRGHGMCGKCEILVLEGTEHLTPRTPKETKKLHTEDPTVRLACQCALMGEGHVTINTLCS